MADHIYEGAVSVTSTATAGLCIAEIIPAAWAAGKRAPEIREIGIFNSTGVANEIGIGVPAAIGVTPATETTVQAVNRMDVIAGNTVIATTWGTRPTVPATFMRRAPLQSVIGTGIIWVWNPGEFVLAPNPAVNTLIVWQFAANIVTYDLYVKCAE